MRAASDPHIAQIVVNYANFLEENDYFEESFKVYERALDLFSYPIKFELLNAYLAKFIKRFGGSKMERARDLFEEATSKCPPKFAKNLFLMYGKLEEEHGLAKRAMRVYEMAVDRVDKADQFEVGRPSFALLEDGSEFFPSKRLSRCSLPRLPSISAFQQRATSIKEVSRSFPIVIRPKCVFALPHWKGNLAKSTGREQYMLMALNSATRVSIQHTGKLGTLSNWRPGRRTHSEKSAHFNLRGGSRMEN